MRTTEGMEGLHLQQEGTGLDLLKDFLTKNREDTVGFLKSPSRTADEIRHWLQTSHTHRCLEVAHTTWRTETAEQGREGLSLTVDAQRGLAPLVAGYAGVPPSLSPLHTVNEEPVHEAILLKDDSIPGAELQTRAAEEPVIPTPVQLLLAGGSRAPYECKVGTVITATSMERL